MALLRWPKSPLYNSNGVSPNESPLMPNRLRRAFGDAGFIDIRQRAQADIPYRAVAPKLLNACLSLYNVGDWLMARSHLDRFFGNICIIYDRAKTCTQMVDDVGNERLANLRGCNSYM